jgi:polysaccharide biosynthesis protein PslE
MSTMTTFEPAAIDMIEEPPRPSLRNLAHIVYKRKWLVLMIFICSATVATTAVRLFTKPVYVASSQILVSPSREQVVDQTMQTGGAVPPWLGFNAVEQTAWVREILTGRFLAERVVRAIGPTVLYPTTRLEEQLSPLSAVWAFVAPDKARSPDEVDEKVLQEGAINAFLKSVAAEPAGRSSIINLSFRHENPQLAAKVVNLLGEMYLERHLGVQKNPKSDTFFQEQLPVLKKRLAESEEKILAFKARHDINNSVKTEQELALQQQIGLRKELNDVRSKQAEVQSRDAELRRQLANTSRSPAAIDRLRDRLSTLELQENELALRFTAQNPTLVNLRDEMRKLRKAVSDVEGTKQYGTESSQSSLYASLQAELLHNEAEGRALRAREATQVAKIDELQARLNTLERIQPEFNHLEKQLQLDENNSRLYLTKFEESRISGAMDAEKIASVRVIEQASVPLKPIDAKRKLKVLLGILFSGIGAIAIAFLLQFLGGSLDTAEEVERVLDLPVLASIPRLELK